jgi:hypothetical protein
MVKSSLDIICVLSNSAVGTKLYNTVLFTKLCRCDCLYILCPQSYVIANKLAGGTSASSFRETRWHIS